MNEDTFMFLYIGTFIMVGLLMILPIVLIIVAVVFIKKINHKNNMEMLKNAQERQRAKEKLMQEEIDLKKQKYKRIRCQYCGSLNKIDMVSCVNCGAVLGKE